MGWGGIALCLCAVSPQSAMAVLVIFVGVIFLKYLFRFFFKPMVFFLYV